MALEHASLQGSQVHEPKFIEAALPGQVYVANGSGSGSWQDPVGGILNKNKYFLQTQMTDAAAASSVWFNVPIKSKLTALTVILYGAMDANNLFSIYINGVLFADSLNMAFFGTTAGTKQTATIVTANSIPAESIIEIRSAGSPTASVRADIQLAFEAIA